MGRTLRLTPHLLIPLPQGARKVEEKEKNSGLLTCRGKLIFDISDSFN
jgi:hypothetical protein